MSTCPDAMSLVDGSSAQSVAVNRGLGCSQTRFFLAETDDPKLHLVDTDTGFTGNMLIIETERSESSAFNMILAKSQNTVVFQVTGEGKVTMRDATASGAVTADSFTSSTGATITAVGLQVDAGGVTLDAGPLLVLDGGSVITTAEASTPALTLTGTHTSFDNTILSVASGSTGAGFKLIEASAGGSTKFSVDGTGSVVTQGGVTIVAGGLTVTGGLEVTDTGVTIADGGMRITEPGANSNGLHVLASNAAFASNVITGKTTRAANSAFNMLLLEANGVDLFSVSGTGATTVHQGGLNVDAGGVTVDAGGLTVDGGLTVTAGGLKVTGGLTIADGGLAVLDDGMTVVESDASVPVLDLSASHGTFINSVLRVTATRGSSTAYDFLTLNDNSSPVFRVRVRM